MILLLMGIFMTFSQLLWLGMQVIVWIPVLAAVDVYFFLCTYALYKKFRAENEAIAFASTQSHLGLQPSFYGDKTAKYPESPINMHNVPMYEEKTKEFANSPPDSFTDKKFDDKQTNIV